MVLLSLGPLLSVVRILEIDDGNLEIAHKKNIDIAGCTEWKHSGVSFEEHECDESDDENDSYMAKSISSVFDNEPNNNNDAYVWISQKYAQYMLFVVVIPIILSAVFVVYKCAKKKGKYEKV